MASFRSLASVPGLRVHTPDEEDLFENAISSKAFNKKLKKELYPDAVVIADSVDAVQAAVKFCSENNLKICVRSGGHSWMSIWMQGSGSVILDVGKIDHVHFDEETNLISAGPGAKNINFQIPDNVFFPSGHCPGVPLGGFILGGGYGLGFPKYGLSSSRVKEVQAVLANGEVKIAKYDEKDDPVSKAIMHMVRGSYNRFPAVITNYKLEPVPTPGYVITPMWIFSIAEWRRVLLIARDIAYRGDADTVNMEVLVVLGNTPPPLAEASGVSRMAALSLNLFCDTKEEADILLDKYAPNDKLLGTIAPPGPFDPVPAKKVPENFSPFYPEARYVTEGWVGDDKVYDMTDDQLATMVEPLANMWSSDKAAGPPSHSLLVFVPRESTVSYRGELITDFSQAFVSLSYFIYFDASMDDLYKKILQDAQSGFRTTGLYTEMAEGNIRDDSRLCFKEESKSRVKQYIDLLDPTGMIAREIE